MNIYNIILTILIITIIIGVIKGCGNNRTIIVFRDYDDLGLTFLIPASWMLIYYIFHGFGGNEFIAIVVGGVVALFLLIKLSINTYIDNSRIISKSLLALITKIPMGVIWILNFAEFLNPSGKGSQRSRNRGQALLVLTLLTPILGLLVVNKSGSFFNPTSWLRGRRVGSSVRNSL